MKRLSSFLKSMAVGGLLVILPLAILAFGVSWLFAKVRDAISPLTTIVINRSPIEGLTADLIVIVVLVAVCVTVGALVRTRFGGWLHRILESKLLLKAPGYSLIKETVTQFLGTKKSPFSAVALVQLFGNDTMCSSFVTDEHDDGSFTVFVPTGPNPTSGNIYHLPGRFVHRIDVNVEDAMRTIISCGAGSQVLLKAKAAAAATAAVDG